MEKKRKLLLPMQEMGVKTQNGGPHLLVLYFLSWRNSHGLDG
jgi:hypothetical protein